MTRRVVFAPEAQDQLAALYRYSAAKASPRIAARYTEAVVSYCEGLETFPGRGRPRDDIRPGLRITNYRKRTVIAFGIDDDVISIVGIFYGGRDYQARLRADPLV